MSDPHDPARGGTGVTSTWVTERDALPAWVAALAVDSEVIAPVEAHGGDVIFAPIASPEEVAWDYSNTLLPPKAVVLPQRDPILAIRTDGNTPRVESIPPPGRRVLLGIRSCDVRGLAYLRRCWAADLPDPALLQRLDRLAVISLACTQPCPSGFCVCCDAGPFLTHDFDVQLTVMGDRVLAEVGTAAGEQLVRAVSGLFRPAEETQLATRRQLEDDALAGFGPSTAHIGSAMRRISTGRVTESLWREMAAECFECGSCTLLCPTCSCFSIKDLAAPDGWTRCRLWDSCQFAAFTREASGHNPRGERFQRLRRRFYHKFSAQYFVRDGMAGCVGCGRCVQSCLGTTDVPAVVAAIRHGVWHG